MSVFGPKISLSLYTQYPRLVITFSIPDGTAIYIKWINHFFLVKRNLLDSIVGLKEMEL